MASLRRLLVGWNGLTALPGVSVFYAPVAADPSGDLGTFFNAIKSAFPSTLQWTIPTQGDVIDDATGTLTGVWSPANPTFIAGTGGSTAYAAGVGAYINWSTAAIINGHRLRGRTFLTHLLTSNYDNAGTLATATLTLLQNAAVAMAAGNKLSIWHRPTPGGSNGSSSLVTGALVPDQVTSLRTRRR